MSRICLCLLVSLFLVSCGSLLPHPGEAPKKYLLDSQTNFNLTNTNILNTHLMVDVPTIYAPLDNNRIALKMSPQTIDYYADNEWADRLAKLLHESLIDSFRNTGKIVATTRPDDGVTADYLLKWEVQQFNTDYSNPEKKQAVVTYRLQLIKLPQRQVISTNKISATEDSTKEEMEEIVKTLNLAHLKASKAICEWVIQVIEGSARRHHK